MVPRRRLGNYPILLVNEEVPNAAVRQAVEEAFFTQSPIQLRNPLPQTSRIKERTKSIHERELLTITRCFGGNLQRLQALLGSRVSLPEAERSQKKERVLCEPHLVLLLKAPSNPRALGKPWAWPNPANLMFLHLHYQDFSPNEQALKPSADPVMAQSTRMLKDSIHTWCRRPPSLDHGCRGSSPRDYTCRSGCSTCSTPSSSLSSAWLDEWWPNSAERHG